ncbi:MAG: hypothetical protein J0L53_02650 [Spirochaetes bacterium]|nr:hypothetical protein [Spirochaetota bacterium]
MGAPTLEWVPVIFRAAHWLGVAVYFGSLLFLLVIFQRVYGRYRSYKYVDNFRGEIISLYWRFLHGAFILIVISGAALAGLKGKSVIRGLYGLVFSAKLVLWLVQIYLTQETLKPFTPEVEHAYPEKQGLAPRAVSPILIVSLLLLISLCGFALQLL